MTDNDDIVIRVRGLRTQFGPQVLHDGLELDVKRGEVMAVVGGSGTGKSVLMNTIIGLIRQAEGTIEVLGQDTSRMSTQAAIGIKNALGRAISRWRLIFVPDGVAEYPSAPERIYRFVAIHDQ
jgi:phospholipid/cholesterol/gamma-HCH transport system ATP-binding protein